MYTPWGPDSEVRVVRTVASNRGLACAKASLPPAQQTVTTQGGTQASIARASDFSREPKTSGGQNQGTQTKPVFWIDWLMGCQLATLTQEICGFSDSFIIFSKWF